MKLYIAHIPSLLTEGDEAYYPLLTETRLARAKRLKNADARARCICAGLLLRAEFGGREPALTELEKPYFPDAPAFSLSHSGSWAVLAAGGSSVGADIEQLRKADFRLAERFFHPKEFEYLKQCPDPNLDFTRIWTHKEAFLKAIGTGLTLRPSSFCLPEGGKPLHYEGRDWFFREISLEGCSLTLCDLARAPDPEIIFCDKKSLCL